MSLDAFDHCSGSPHERRQRDQVEKRWLDPSRDIRDLCTIFRRNIDPDFIYCKWDGVYWDYSEKFDPRD